MVDLVPQHRGLMLALERYGPLGLTLAAMAAVYLNGTFITCQFEHNKWQVSNLYSAIFNWSAIQTGFAFSVYGFVAGRSEGFVEAIRETLAMKRFLQYVRHANIGGFALTIFSLPLTIINPILGPINSPQFFVVLGWFGLFVWSFFAFLRIAYSFGHLSSVRDQPLFFGV